MCGFVGEIAPAGGVDAARLEKMAAALAHRGPDERGAVVSPDGRWGLAHRRLCILDFEGGRQPFRAGGLTLVHNGEIYGEEEIRRRLDWPFRTRSDTEVVLALYAVLGLDFFSSLRGEFAFALIDEKRRRAVLVRDRLGMKPLFYVRRPDRFVFASEVKALFQDERIERRLDPAGVMAAVCVAGVPGQTPFKGVRQLPNAHYLTLDLDTLAVEEHPYWDAFENRVREVPESFPEQAALVRATVDEAIDIRLRADVDVGVLLSGGVDSAIVAARLAELGERMPAFTMSYRASPRHDELEKASAIAGRFGLALHEIPVTPEATLEQLPNTVWHMERPFGNQHIVARHIAARWIKPHVSCILTGDGADETFCGYPTYWLQQELEDAGQRLGPFRRRLRAMRREASTLGENRFYLERAARRFGPRTRGLEEVLGFRPVELAISLDNYFTLRPLLRKSAAARCDPPPAIALARHLKPDLPDGAPHGQLLHYLHLRALGPEYVSPVSDRTEMGGSVEAREPLYDHKVAELGMGLPFRSKLGPIEKHVLREAYRDVLPRDVAQRRKHAFLLPPASYSLPVGRRLVERYLGRDAIRDAGIFRPRAVKVMLLAQRLRPESRTLNLGLNVVMTTQILWRHLIAEPQAGRPGDA